MAYCCKYCNEHSDLIKYSEIFQGVRKVSFPKRTLVHELEIQKSSGYLNTLQLSHCIDVNCSLYFVVSAASDLHIDI